MSVTSNDIGTLWTPNYNNIAWTQPGGKGTAVLPAQANNAPFTNYPVPGQVINEVGMSLWTAGCGHGFDKPLLQTDYDSANKISCMVVACPICSFIISLIEPATEAYNVLSHPIVIP